jgi:hypothetical protein
VRHVSDAAPGARAGQRDLLLLGVVGVRVAGLDELERLGVEVVEVVGRVRDLVAADLEEREVLENRLLELCLPRREFVLRGLRARARTFSLLGFVSSKRMIMRPWYMSAKYLLSSAALVCPMCRYPLGSGGKRVTTWPSTAPSRPSAKDAAVLAPRALLARASASCASAACVLASESRCASQRARCGCLPFLSRPMSFVEAARAGRVSQARVRRAAGADP